MTNVFVQKLCFSLQTITPACVLVFLIPAILAFWPVDALEIRLVPTAAAKTNDLVLRAPTLLGQNMTASIIHSVQRTPVIDIYRVQEGRIWAWQEKIMSHNAGLPSVKPDRGRFIYDAPWMVVEGGGKYFQDIRYRVGTEELGTNVLCAFALPCRELWREVPGSLLAFRVVKVTL